MDHSHNIPDDHHPMAGQPYGFFTAQEDPSYLAYSQIPYQVVQQHAGAPTQLHQQHYGGLNLMSPHAYQPNVYAGSPPHVSLPLSTTTPSPSPELFDDPVSPPISGSDTSGEGLYQHSNSSGANSPSSSRANSLVHRHTRYNPTPSPTSSSGRRSRTRSHDSDDEDNMGASFVENLAHSRKEATRRQRIEAEQRRRDELRDGYAKLKDVLPVSNQKSSKVSLLERATNHIVALEKANKELQARLTALEQESQRLRAVNEKILLPNESEMFDGRPLSPPPDGPPAHSLVSTRGQEPPSEDSSPSASDSGF